MIFPSFYVMYLRYLFMIMMPGVQLSPPVEERIQSRPLPAPPAPPRNIKKKSASIEEAEARTPSRNSDRSVGEVTATENFRTCAESLNTSKTLRGASSREEDDITLAESVVDSLVSCAETLVGDNENLESCMETLRDEEFYSDEDLDNPYPAVDFDRAGAGATIVEDEERPGRSLDKKRDVKKSESKKHISICNMNANLKQINPCVLRWAETGGGHPAALHGAYAPCGEPQDHPGQHVQQVTCDWRIPGHMTTMLTSDWSNRLGTRSRSRSHSKTRNNNLKDSL